MLSRFGRGVAGRGSARVLLPQTTTSSSFFSSLYDSYTLPAFHSSPVFFARRPPPTHNNDNNDDDDDVADDEDGGGDERSLDLAKMSEEVFGECEKDPEDAPLLVSAEAYERGDDTRASVPLSDFVNSAPSDEEFKKSLDEANAGTVESDEEPSSIGDTNDDTSATEESSTNDDSTPPTISTGDAVGVAAADALDPVQVTEDFHEDVREEYLRKHKGKGKKFAALERRLYNFRKSVIMIYEKKLVKQFDDADRLFADAIIFYNKMHHSGMAPLEVYNTMMEVYRRERKWEESEEVLAQLREVGHVPSMGTFRTMLTSYFSQKKFAKAEECIKEIRESGFPIDEKVYFLIINQYCNFKNFDRAEEAMDQMIADGVATTDAFNHMMLIYVNNQDYESGRQKYLQLIDFGFEPNEWTYYLLMKVYGRLKPKRPDLVLQTYREMRAKGYRGEIERWAFNDLHRIKRCPVDIYNNTIQMYRVTQIRKDAKRAEKCYTKMIGNSVVPNARTYKLMVQLYCERKEDKKAEQFFNAMHRAGYTPRADLYRYMILMYNVLGRYDRAEDMFARMLRDGMANSATFKRLLRVCKKSKHTADAVMYYRGMQKAGLADKFMYKAMYEFCYKFKHDYVDTVFEDAQRDGLLDELLRWLIKHHNTKLGKSLFEKIQVAGAATTETYNLFLPYCLYDLHLYERAETALQQMRDAGIPMDAETYRHAFDVCNKNENYEQALQLYEEAREQDIPFCLTAMEHLIEGFARSNNFENAETLLEQMREQGLTLTLPIATSMIDVYTQMEEFDKAEQVWLELKETPIDIDEQTYRLVASLYEAAGESEKQEAIEAEMIGALEHTSVQLTA